jgi:hypothetical protein
VEGDRGEETDHTAWHGARSDGQGVVFGHGLAGEAVQTSRGALEQTLADSAAELLAVDTRLRGIGRSHDLAPARQPQEAFSTWPRIHV